MFQGDMLIPWRVNDAQPLVASGTCFCLILPDIMLKIVAPNDQPFGGLMVTNPNMIKLMNV